MSLTSWIEKVEQSVFGHRRWVLGIVIAVSLGMVWSVSNLRIDAGFAKQLPVKHEYMKGFSEYSREFGGANRVLVALMAREGDIFTPGFFAALKDATEDVFFLNGVDRSRVMSLFTPNVRFVEVDEEGFVGGNVVPRDFRATPEELEQVRGNVLKSRYVGRLVANDFSGAIISAELLDVDPNTGERLDYLRVAHDLEQGLRKKYENDEISVHVIGFAKVVGDVVDGTARVVLFFGVAFLITAIMVYGYTRSAKLTTAALGCSMVAVLWQLGSLPLLGLGIDPMGILVPFLVFAIGVSHAVQMVCANGAEVFEGANSLEAARRSFRRLAVPGMVALVSDTLGFFVIRIIDIPLIREMALTASLGVGMIILANLVFLPVLLSYVTYDEAYQAKLHSRSKRMAPVWSVVSRLAQRGPASVVIVVAAGLAVFGYWRGTAIKVGDLQSGVPELRKNSRYNVDAGVITNRFSLGVDVFTVYAETKPDGCVDYDVMSTMDEFGWHMANVAGIQSVASMAGAVKASIVGWNEGHPRWYATPRDEALLAQAGMNIETSSGLLNDGCSVMPIHLNTADHKAETLSRVVEAVKEFRQQTDTEKVYFRLAGGNAGVMAATNEEVLAAQFPTLLCVFGAVIALCFITFRSVGATLCVILPLGLVSLLGYALMEALEIGLKVNTLPVVALGVGIGVDYGIYIYSRLQSFLDEGKSLREAYEHTLDITGNAVVLTGATLAGGVATWIFSPLKFQADMGVLLAFMFFVNMLGAIVLLPALAAWISRPRGFVGGG